MNNSVVKSLVIISLAFCLIGFTWGKTETRKPQELSSNSESSALIQADKIAKELIERKFWTNHKGLVNLAIIFDPTQQPDYHDILSQLRKRLKSGEASQRQVYEEFGYDGGKIILYIIQEYDSWKKLKNYTW